MLISPLQTFALQWLMSCCIADSDKAKLKTILESWLVAVRLALVTFNVRDKGLGKTMLMFETRQRSQ